MTRGEDVDDIYSDLSWTSIADTFPEKFDLRDRGIVTPVKNQSPWGTCWSFATMAASENSILSSLGLTAAEYQAQTGEEMDLSENIWHGSQPRRFPVRKSIRKARIPTRSARRVKEHIRSRIQRRPSIILAATFSSPHPACPPVSVL